MVRRRRAAAGLDPAVSTDHHRRLKNPFEPLRVLSDDHVAHIHSSALGYLADEGMRVLLDEARDIFAAAGHRSMTT